MPPPCRPIPLHATAKDSDESERNRRYKLTFRPESLSVDTKRSIVYTNTRHSQVNLGGCTVGNMICSLVSTVCLCFLQYLALLPVDEYFGRNIRVYLCLLFSPLAAESYFVFINFLLQARQLSHYNRGHIFNSVAKWHNKWRTRLLARQEFRLILDAFLSFHQLELLHNSLTRSPSNKGLASLTAAERHDPVMASIPRQDKIEQ